MSCPEEQPTPTQVEVEDIMNVFVQDGELDVEAVKCVKTCPLGRREINYTYKTQDGFSLSAHIYWVQEGDEVRQYFHMEVALTKIIPSSNTPILIFALERNRCVPAPIKLALSDHLLTLSFRCATNGLTQDYLRDLIGGMIPFGALVLSDLREEFGDVPTVMQALWQEETRTGLH
jgi:hypothetical protein